MYAKFEENTHGPYARYNYSRDDLSRIVDKPEVEHSRLEYCAVSPRWRLVGAVCKQQPTGQEIDPRSWRRVHCCGKGISDLWRAAEGTPCHPPLAEHGPTHGLG